MKDNGIYNENTEIKLHFLPEKPNHSCEVLAFHQQKTTGRIYNVTNVPFSTKYSMFNVYDHFTAEEADESAEFNGDIVAWAYMDEIDKALQSVK